MGKWLEDWDIWTPQRGDGYGKDDGLLAWLVVGKKMIPNFIFTYLLRLPPIQFKTIMGLQGFDINLEGWLCHPSGKQMAERWGVSERTAKRWLELVCDRVTKDGEVVEGLVIRRPPRDGEERRRMKKGNQEGRKIFEFGRLGKNAFQELLGLNYDDFAGECEETKADREYAKAKKKRLRKEAIQEERDDLAFSKRLQEGGVPADIPIPTEVPCPDTEVSEEELARQREERIDEAIEKMKGEEPMKPTPTLQELKERLEEVKRSRGDISDS